MSLTETVDLIFCFRSVIVGQEYLCVGSKLHSLLSGDSVTWVEDGCGGNGSEHGQILQAHLRWPVFT